jgi:hypothetical protein
MPHTPPQNPYNGPQPSVPLAPAAPVPAPSGRMDQVRAELDELSDYLRNRPGQPGRPGGAPPTGDGDPGRAGTGG